MKVGPARQNQGRHNVNDPNGEERVGIHGSAASADPPTLGGEVRQQNQPLGVHGRIGRIDGQFKQSKCACPQHN